MHTAPASGMSFLLVSLMVLSLEGDAASLWMEDHAAQVHVCVAP